MRMLSINQILRVLDRTKSFIKTAGKRGITSTLRLFTRGQFSLHGEAILVTVLDQLQLTKSSSAFVIFMPFLQGGLF